MAEQEEQQDVIFDDDEKSEEVELSDADEVEWVEYESNSGFFKPEEEGEDLIGVVVGTEETQYGEAVKVQKRDGSYSLVNYQSVNSSLKENKGELVRLVYQGLKTGESGREYKDFDLMVAKSSDSE
jgi:uncharacterized protein with von Willebrand factor type A (vWA) domain